MGYAEIGWPWRRSPTIQRSIVRLTTACLGTVSVGEWSLSQDSISSMTLSVLWGRERLAGMSPHPSTPLERRTFTRMIALLRIGAVRRNESTRSMRWRGRHLLVNRIDLSCVRWLEKNESSGQICSDSRVNWTERRPSSGRRASSPLT